MPKPNRTRRPAWVTPLALALALVLPWAAAGASPEKPAPERYRECVALARSDPEKGFEAAIAWRDAFGGDPARHCVAVALIGLGKFAEAARRLEALAEEMRTPPEPRAEALGQAAQAWMLAGDHERANAVLGAALELVPAGPLAAGLLTDRGVVLASARNYWEAIDDFSRAIDIAPGEADVYVFRAAAYRYVDSPELAMDDLERALALAPDHPQALLERGILRRMGNDIKGARADWLKVITQAPDSQTAEIARANIERLELRIGPAPPPRR
ncbi:MAG: tetratricopeptide repeat protein [Proteobacteria bacterium]|nr:tetratricopeptide repeat protein [Pseudomonadota bacterium]